MSYLTWRIWISFLSIIFTLLLFELGYRFVKNTPFKMTNVLSHRINLFASSYPTRFDESLGWTPRPGDHSENNVWSTEVNIDASGFRKNGRGVAIDSTHPTILAVGDSFTFGDQVSDADTWPSFLEKLTGARVVNAGVFGYGVDQMILRAESVIQELHPAWIIISFIPDDIQRCELAVRTGVYKPYFTWDDGLFLHNVPVPRPQSTYRQIGLLRAILGYSYLADAILMKHCKAYWLSGIVGEDRVHNQGVQIVCALFSRFEAEIAKRGIRGLVVIQMPKRIKRSELAKLNAVRECLKKTSLSVVDLENPLQEIKRTDARRYTRFFSFHMTPEGNRWVAEQIATVLKPHFPDHSLSNHSYAIESEN